MQLIVGTPSPSQSAPPVASPRGEEMEEREVAEETDPPHPEGGHPSDSDESGEDLFDSSDEVSSLSDV